MVATCVDTIHVLICHTPEVLETCTHLSVTKTELPVFISTACVDISSLSQHERVILTCSDLLNLLACEILNESRFKDVLGRPVAQLSLLAIPKSIQASINSQHHRVLPSSRDCLNL